MQFMYNLQTKLLTSRYGLGTVSKNKEKDFNVYILIFACHDTQQQRMTLVGGDL